MSISPLGPNIPITRLQGSTATVGTQRPQDAGQERNDTVEISDTARYLSEIKKLPEVRADKVAAAKQSIANGTMDTPAKLDKVVEGVLQDIQ